MLKRIGLIVICFSFLILNASFASIVTCPKTFDLGQEDAANWIILSDPGIEKAPFIVATLVFYPRYAPSANCGYEGGGMLMSTFSVKDKVGENWVRGVLGYRCPGLGSETEPDPTLCPFER